jgi:hypothetical protein
MGSIFFSSLPVRSRKKGNWRNLLRPNDYYDRTTDIAKALAHPAQDALQAKRR